MSLKKSRQDMKVYLLEDYVEAAAGDHSEDDEDAPAMLAQLYNGIGPKPKELSYDDLFLGL